LVRGGEFGRYRLTYKSETRVDSGGEVDFLYKESKQVGRSS
jgi:hypothetical protein